MAQHKRILRQINNVFSENALVDICDRSALNFAQYGTLTQFADGRYYYFKDNGANILAVAHLDSVQTAGGASVATLKSGSKVVFSPTLDDRLGAWVILDLLPRLGIKTDILLTSDEEVGQSSAELFRPPAGKRYNWMFSFDRAGTDVVMYQYRAPKYLDMLREVGFDTDFGSFSCIRDLDFLGCRGFNFGVGYHDYHSRRAYAWLDDTFDMVARFVRFYRLHSNERMEYDKKKDSYYQPSYDWDGYNYGMGYAMQNRSKGDKIGSSDFKKRWYESKPHTWKLKANIGGKFLIDKRYSGDLEETKTEWWKERYVETNIPGVWRDKEPEEEVPARVEDPQVDEAFALTVEERLAQRKDFPHDKGNVFGHSSMAECVCDHVAYVHGGGSGVGRCNVSGCDCTRFCLWREGAPLLPAAHDA